MAFFICNECNYRYESELKQEGKKCPYCGNGKISLEPLAEELVNGDF